MNIIFAERGWHRDDSTFGHCGADLHIVEPADLWDRYIDPVFKDRAPRGLSRHPRALGVQVGESVFPLPNRSYANTIAPLMTGQQDIYTDAEARHWDSDSQVTAMEKEGIDRAVLFPSRGLFTLGVDGMDPALATAISRAYNDWLAEFCASGSDRMFSASMRPPHDIEGAISEVFQETGERCRFPLQGIAYDGDCRSPTIDVGRKLFGIFSSLLLLYSWCACSGMSRL